MICQECGFDCPSGMNFCGNCGHSLLAVCKSCGAKNSPKFKFCGECGKALVHETAEQVEKTPKKNLPKVKGNDSNAERRQLSVMFCDLVGSTALSEQLDPEDLRQVIRAFQEVGVEIFKRYDGYISKYLGDGVLVYFGYPCAHEDSAYRAVRAGLELVGSMDGLNLRLQREYDVELKARIGIHTGLVVAGEMGAGEALEENAIVGRTPNLAARLEGVAPENGVAISNDTFRLVRGFFNCKSLGSKELKGIAKPIAVHQVLEETGARGRIEAAVATQATVTPFVGRKQQLSFLLESWEQVKEGQGATVMISGEAGIGKSRLRGIFKEKIATEPHSWFQCHCSPFHQHSVLYPIIDLLQRVLQFQREDNNEEKLRKLTDVLTQLRFDPETTVPLLAELLSLSLDGSFKPLELSAKERLKKTLEVLLLFLPRLANHGPVIFVVEDLHWVDPTTLKLLDLLIEQGPLAQIFTILSFRPSFTPRWMNRTRVSHITLTPFRRKKVLEMVLGVTGGKQLPPEILDEIVEKTDGVPLFVEELTKTIIESELLEEKETEYQLHGSIPPLAIPTTLQDSLLARLDRMGPVREIAQLGATLGRHFAYDLIRGIAPVDESALRDALGQLVKAEVLYQRGFPPDAEYLFKHALIQETAYFSLLRSKRREVHKRVAEVLETDFADLTKAQPELLAHHFTGAEVYPEAISRWRKAGRLAYRRSANEEAIAHLTRGLALVDHLSPGSEKDQLELALQTALGPALMSSKGFGSPEVEAAYARARELCERSGDVPQLVPVYRGLSLYYINRVDLDSSHSLCEQLLRIARRLKRADSLFRAHTTMGQNLFHQGELAAAKSHLEQGFSYFDEKGCVENFEHIPRFTYLCYGAWTLWLLGYPDRSLALAKQALSLGDELGHPFSLAVVKGYVGVLFQFRREYQDAREMAFTAIEVASARGVQSWLSMGQILRGVTANEIGDAEIEDIQKGIEGWKESGSMVGIPYYLSLLSSALIRAQKPEKAVEVIHQALSISQETRERWWEADILRIEAELLLKHQNDADAAEQSLLSAIDIAESQQGKMLQLRATNSLVRLRLAQGKGANALEMLADTYAWFTEGFETKDLREARELLGYIPSEDKLLANQRL